MRPQQRNTNQTHRSVPSPAGAGPAPHRREIARWERSSPIRCSQKSHSPPRQRPRCYVVSTALSIGPGSVTRATAMCSSAPAAAFADRRRQADGASLRNEYTVDAGTFGGPQNRSQVARILHRVQPRTNGGVVVRLPAHSGHRADHRRRDNWRQQFWRSRPDALLPASARSSANRGARCTGTSARLRQLQQLAQALVTRAFDDRDLFELLASGTQSFEDGNQSVDQY